MTRRTLISLGTGLGALLALLAAIVFVPALLRSDELTYEWTGAIGADVLEEPIGIARVAERLYVTDAVENEVVVFDTTGALAEVWAGEPYGFERPMHIHYADGELYVAEFLSDRITVLDPGGHVTRRIGNGAGSEPGELDAPGGATSLHGQVYVADFYNHRVKAFGPDEATRALGRPGRGLAGRFHYPTDVAATESLLYVADAYNNRIQVVRPTGRQIRRWGGPFGTGLPGSLRGWFRVATGVSASGGDVYVADFYNDRVQVFDSRGRYRGQIADSLYRPTAAVTDDAGKVYVADFGNGRVATFVRTPQAPTRLRTR